jgi:myo-inositol-1(or 4)-monophosphatase
MPNFSEFTLVAIEAAKKAGHLLKEGFLSHSFHIMDKGVGIQNLVTEYDLLSEKCIIEHLKNEYPKHSFWGEEGGKKEGANKILWIIDPLDGTVNFAHGIPHFCVSIAVQEMVGVIYHPILDELFVAEKNKGAYLNGKKLQIGKVSSLKETFSAIDLPYNLKENPHGCIERLAKSNKLGIPLRCLGSAALDLAFVAAGRIDLFWETSLMPWDYAAGKIIVEESGGQVTSWWGEKMVYKEDGETLVAANPTLCKLAMKEFLG